MATDKEGYIKKSTTYEEQINILKARNLYIENEEFALSVLKRINYYRLSAYMLTFKTKQGNYAGATFNTIYELYRFDKELRNLLLPLLEDIEIAIRAQISYLHAHKYGPFGYEDAKNFRNNNFHKVMLVNFHKEIDRSDEIFISHHKRQYHGEFPVWVAIEVASFGVLSKMYNNLLQDDQDAIASLYNTNGLYLRTWLHALSNLRNKCAHYGRLYNRKLTVTPKLFKATKRKGINSDTLFGDVYVIGRLSKKTDEWGKFIANLRNLIQHYEVVELSALGFPIDWEKILKDI